MHSVCEMKGRPQHVVLGLSKLYLYHALFAANVSVVISEPEGQPYHQRHFLSLSIISFKHGMSLSSANFPMLESPLNLDT